MEGNSEVKPHICVVVLGDFGRSPRMQYHCLSLAAHDFNVDIVAYGGSKPHNDLLHKRNIFFHLMRDPPKFELYVPRLLVYVLKVFWQSFVLLYTLFSLTRPQHILVQNPPAIPTLPVVWIYSWLRRSHLVVDWHNYGFTILGLTLGKKHILTKLCKWCEKYFGSKAEQHLCVTIAMKEDLSIKWNIDARVLYDRPPVIFHPAKEDESHALLLKLSMEYPELKLRGQVHESNCDNENTRFTERINGIVQMKKKRPALIISSTSWTEDEDFSILLEALEGYEEAVNSRSDLPDIVCAVTGKGPMKAYYQKEIEKKRFQHIIIITPWLSAEDYPILLGSADLGVCLHTSSSGLDLPMKVVDMFGCCVPVCAVYYNCIGELVEHGENGFVFKTSQELCQQMQDLLFGFPENEQLKAFRSNLKCSYNLKWDESWDFSAFSLFSKNA